MILSDHSIKNPVFAWMLMAAMILFGVIGFLGIGKSQLPDVDFPVLTVSVKWEGASPEVMETEVVDAIEDGMTSVKGVKKISSVTRQGQALVTVEFDLKTDVDVALQEVQSKISQAQYKLPKDIDPPIISKFNPDDQPYMWISLSGERSPREIMLYVKDELKDNFTTIPGVGDVFLGGFIEPSVRVWLDPERMRAREITVSDVLDALRLEHTELPAGYLSTAQKEWNLRVMGEAQSVAELENLVISGRSGMPIYTPFRLKDIAAIEDGLADARAAARVDGKPAVGLGILKQRNANAVEVARRVKKKVEELQASLPQGMRLAVNYDGSQFIEDSTGELNFNLVMAALLTSIICYLFLGSWSSAVNIILAIPTSILGTFIVLYFLGWTQNTFTLLGLTLVIGIVVDDAIMVLENIVRHREMGQSQVKAALVGAREIYSPALAASLAILAIFVPVLFVKGVIGKYFLQFGVTISAAVALSLLEALTLAPMRCSQFLEIGSPNRLARAVDRGMNLLRDGYRVWLTRCLGHRWKVLIGSTLVFAASLGLFGVVKKELMPPQDQNMLMYSLETPVGSSLQFTDEVFKRAESYILSRPEVARYYTSVGGWEGGEINTGMSFVTLKPPRERPIPNGRSRPYSQQELMNVVRVDLSSMTGVSKAILFDLSTGGGGAESGFPIDFTLQGRDWDRLAALSGTFQERMKGSGLMVDVNSNYKLGMPEIQIRPNRVEAARRGVSVSVIADAVNATLGGVRAGKFSQGGHRYDIRVRFRPEDRTKVGDIDKILLRNNRGQVLPMADVVEIAEKRTLLSITRQDRSRAISLFANVAPGKSQAEALEAVDRIAKDVLPEGVKLVYSGTAETFKEAFMGLFAALILGVVVAYMVLGAQFNSFVHPVLVLLALPFSVTGAVVALVLGGQTLNMFSMIGLVLLMGIVKKNSILLVDFTNERRRWGLGVNEALIAACPVRLRPIVMTSAATIAAAIPPALALGPGAETRVPMALVIIGGVSVSAVLTLFVVPCAYSLMARLESRKHHEKLREALRELEEQSEPAGSRIGPAIGSET
ncbi:MAG: efflux RND transporter permease subunit [Elusimicrobia bacterium]|nr:efflux RND transporter permease subunit [Elusimicrobiota bacterium]